jgi:hypothetical protein|tara:strand:- start:264 stop:512 length:249 start_codon:yes stop_codon:yes gene_type:complete
MRWVLVKNIREGRGIDRLATVVDEYGDRLIYNSKKEAEKAAADMTKLDETGLEMYEGLRKEVMIHSMGPILIIPEQETLYND